MEDLKEEIANEEFGMVLGVDGSGRVPALIIEKVIKHVSPVEVRFIAGSRPEEGVSTREDELEEYFSGEVFKALKAEGKRVLIVEDTLVTGESLVDICRALQNKEVEYEIVSLSYLGSKKISSGEFSTRLGAKVHFSGKWTPSIYRKKKMSGVYKEKGDVFAKPLAKYEDKSNSSIPDARSYGGGEDDDEIFMDDPEVLRHTRKLVKEVSDDIIKKLDL
ncbi:hypothetical protein COB52_00815 [Candidatus Kaiserbacteria bacterium]|nr:MAG: hypothetical protein COB52_00815 [Candidatus Kaiserbacteria bacterium]